MQINSSNQSFDNYFYIIIRLAAQNSRRRNVDIFVLPLKAAAADVIMDISALPLKAVAGINKSHSLPGSTLPFARCDFAYQLRRSFVATLA